LIRLSHSRAAARPAVLGAVALTAVVAVAGCGSSSSVSSGSGSGSGTSQSSTVQQCLKKHGFTASSGRRPGGGGGGNGGSATPRPRPTGSAASSFRQAIKACGGSFG
jgi:hypothetical protein